MQEQAKVRFRTLRAFRLATHGSQAAAAAAFNISQSEWSRFESGDRTPKKALAKRLAQASGMSTISLLTGSWRHSAKAATLLFAWVFG